MSAHPPIMLNEVGAVADRFWRDLAVLAARETPELQTDVIRLGLAAVGTRLSAPACDRLDMVINMEVAHLRGARPMKRDTVDVLRMVALPPDLALPAHSTNNVVPLSKYRRVINE